MNISNTESLLADFWHESDKNVVAVSRQIACDCLNFYLKLEDNFSTNHRKNISSWILQNQQFVMHLTLQTVGFAVTTTIYSGYI